MKNRIGWALMLVGLLMVSCSPLIGMALAAPSAPASGKLTDEQWASIRKMCETEGCAILDATGMARLSQIIEDAESCRRKRI